MKIVDVKFYPIKVRNNAKGGVYWFLLKLTTDFNVSGWGEVIWNAYDPGTLRRMVMDVAENYIIGESPLPSRRCLERFTPSTVRCTRICPQWG